MRKELRQMAVQRTHSDVTADIACYPELCVLESANLSSSPYATSHQPIDQGNVSESVSSSVKWD